MAAAQQHRNRKRKKKAQSAPSPSALGGQAPVTPDAAGKAPAKGTGHPVFVFASDSLKGTLSSHRAAALLAEEARKVFPQAECRQVVVADGGEGTAEAVAAQTGAELIPVRVQGPLVVSVDAEYALMDAGAFGKGGAAGSRERGAAGSRERDAGSAGRIAVMDVASASGLTLVPPEQRDPLQASSYGTGQLIRTALDAGARELYIGLGGSATVDGGMGMLAALGVRFWDAGNWTVPANGANLADVASVDTSGLDPRLADCTVHALCDVDNPLLGPDGAARVFAPQKGADAAMVGQLESGMANYARAMEASVGEGFATMPGAGAAGGLGFALASVLHATLEPGIDCVLDLIGFDGLLAGADLCITGEGRLDAQTLHGKAASGVAARCKRAGVPCAAIVGARADDATDSALAGMGITQVEACFADGTPWNQVQEQAEDAYRAAVRRLFEGFRAAAE